jgi:hypothetical protein
MRVVEKKKKRSEVRGADKFYSARDKTFVVDVVGVVVVVVVVLLLLYANRHRSILGTAGHIILTPTNQLMEE